VGRGRAGHALEYNSGMTDTLVERLWAWLHETFPERQIYVRSDSRVQFFTISPTLQATTAGLCVIFLTWVAFATVNVVFKDRIIASKDHRYQEMQSAYESRLADLQGSYDELNGALIAAEDRFKSTADELQVKQNTIMKFVDRKEQVDATLRSFASGGATLAKSAHATDATIRPQTVPSDADSIALSSATHTSSSEIEYKPVPPQVTDQPSSANILDIGHVVGQLRNLVFGPRAAAALYPTVPATLVSHPGLKTLDTETERVRQIGTAETEMLSGTERRLDEKVANLQGIIRQTGIDPKKYLSSYSAAEGVGGPDMPIQSVRIAGIEDPKFNNAYMNASAVLEEMDSLVSALRHIPLATPIAANYDPTSVFGPRIDPFTGQASFHPGIDLAGPYGSIVAATAPGSVVWAGARGGYGNLVEIDHGFGIRTRYAHLSAILVHPGEKVLQGTPIGKLGSTGRSTGPHVHYEVWYADVVRNPDKFIETGRHVLE